MVIAKNYQVGLDTSDSLQFQGGPAGRYSIRENNLGFAHAISYLDIDHDGYIDIFFMMDQMIIREATKSDVNEIYQLVNLAFNNNEESNLICDLITNDDVLINLVATSTTTILGNIVVSKMLLIPTLDLFCGAIGPLSVLPDYQSKGIGSKLIEIAISESKINKLDALFVLGSPKFYQKFGFKKSNLENEYNTQNFQELEITKECLTNIDSKIHYAEAFSNLS